MRLLRLALEGFGVYSEPLELDFEKLPANSLFLVHGPTGGGKSMLLDAISFALFDETATLERSGARLRSDHAGPERATWVILEFALGGTAYRVRRTPSYDRPAQRGDGFVTQPAKVEFHKLREPEAGAEPVALLGTRKKEVDRHIQELLGIDAAQFQQLVIIPQGRFREILTASSRDRERVMATLFRTDRLARLQAFMKSRVGELQNEIRAKRERREAVLQGLEVKAEHEMMPEISKADARIEALKAAVIEASGQAQQTREVLEKAKDHNRKLLRLEQAQVALATLDQQQDEQQERQKRLAEARGLQSLEPLFDRLREAEQTRVDAERERATAKERLDAVRQKIERADRLQLRQIGEALALLRRIEMRAGEERRAVGELEAELVRLEAHWRTGRAGYLASQLMPGEPCPVCGARDHPSPAQLDRETPEDAVIEAQREALEAARTKQQSIERRFETMRESLRTLAIDFGTAPIEGPATSPDKKLAELRAHQNDVEQLRHQEARLSSAWEVAERQAEAAVERVEATRQSLLTALETKGFSSIETALEQRLDPARMSDLEEALEAFQRREIEVQTRLASAREEAPEGDPVLLDPLETQAGEAEAVRDQMLREDEAANIRKQRLLAGQDDLNTLHDALEELDRRYAVEGRVAALANGEGGAERVTFQRFVLAALLDEALDAASQRLRVMSRGRYLLRRALTAADRRQVTGLDLEVDDAYTGRARPVGTLSGGESFLASLALALGMADVVARHAGGIRLETMFIDEGFGSLDPEALDLAMRTLIDLRQEGRTIGIVSHVPELKERIDYRLEVKATAQGSRAIFVLP